MKRIRRRPCGWSHPLSLHLSLFFFSVNKCAVLCFLAGQVRTAGSDANFAYEIMRGWVWVIFGHCEFVKCDCTDIKLLKFLCASWDSKQMCHLRSELCQHFITVHQNAPVSRPHDLPSQQQSREETCCVDRCINLSQWRNKQTPLQLRIPICCWLQGTSYIMELRFSLSNHSELCWCRCFSQVIDPQQDMEAVSVKTLGS